jgi:hypothetical protein
MRVVRVDGGRALGPKMRGLLLIETPLALLVADAIAQGWPK